MGRIKYLEAIGKTPKRGCPPVGPMPSRADLAKLLIAKGANVNAKGKYG